jgi:hypothetical protein
MVRGDVTHNRARATLAGGWRSVKSRRNSGFGSCSNSEQSSEALSGTRRGRSIHCACQSFQLTARLRMPVSNHACARSLRWSDAQEDALQQLTKSGTDGVQWNLVVGLHQGKRALVVGVHDARTWSSSDAHGTSFWSHNCTRQLKRTPDGKSRPPYSTWTVSFDRTLPLQRSGRKLETCATCDFQVPSVRTCPKMTAQRDKRVESRSLECDKHSATGFAPQQRPTRPTTRILEVGQGQR